MRLVNKVVIITGAGAGIGEATAKLFAKEGAKVVCCSQSESAKNVAQEIKKTGRQALFVQGDVAEKETCESIVNKTISIFRQIDILPKRFD